jgi:hypothetical protein
VAEYKDFFLSLGTETEKLSTASLMGDPWGPRFALLNEGFQIPFPLSGRNLAYRFGGGFRSALHTSCLYICVKIVKIWSRDHELTGSDNLSLVQPWHKNQLATGHWSLVCCSRKAGDM